ncbi:MAG TPA: hypothetical protein ENN69_08105 [Spirochaetia bacterium]|nr:hypothetical protein [Spirochaetia bacterium]
MRQEEERLIRDFLIYLKANDYRLRTIQGMKRSLRRLFAYLAERGLRPEDVRPAEAQGFQGYLVEQGRADGRPYTEGSVANFIKAAKTFYEYLRTAGKVTANPFAAVRRIRIPKKIPSNFLKEKEMHALLEAFTRFDRGKSVKEKIRTYKTHVIAELLYATGMRIDEAAKLTPQDLDLGRGVARVEDGKGGRSRECFLTAYAKETVRLYLEEFHGLIFHRLSNPELLFGASADPLGKMLNRRVREACRKLGLPVITSHGFRHSLGLHLLRSGCDIRHIAQILGHERLKNTEIYTRVEKEDLKSVLDACHPRRFVTRHEKLD